MTRVGGAPSMVFQQFLLQVFENELQIINKEIQIQI